MHQWEFDYYIFKGKTSFDRQQIVGVPFDSVSQSEIRRNSEPTTTNQSCGEWASSLHPSLEWAPSHLLRNIICKQSSWAESITTQRVCNVQVWDRDVRIRRCTMEREYKKSSSLHLTNHVFVLCSSYFCIEEIWRKMKKKGGEEE